MITICVASLVWGVWWRVNILFILCKYIETRYLDKDQSALPAQLLYNINMTSNQPLLNKYKKNTIWISDLNGLELSRSRLLSWTFPEASTVQFIY